MKRFLYAAAALGVGLAAPAQAIDVPSKPNVIYILADDLGYGDLGSYGQTKIRTPNLGQMADEGMRFTQFYCGNPVCAPSRCTLLTGKHQGHAAIRNNKKIGDVGDYPLPAGSFTLGHLMKNQGYRTACIGKWGNGMVGTSGDPMKQGFHYFFGYDSQILAHNYYPTHLWRNNQKIMLEGNNGQSATGRYYSHDMITNEALRWVRYRKDDRFFLMLTFTIPHLALQVPNSSLQEYAGAFPEIPYDGRRGYLPHRTPRAAYAAMVTRMDRDIGRLFALLKELNIDEETLVFFNSDNGATYNVGGADTPFFNSNGGLRGHKEQLWEGGIRVPFIARWPGQIAAGSTSALPSASWDVFSTLSQLTAAPERPGIDGISLLPTLLGQPGQVQHNFLYWEFHSKGGTQAVRTGDWKGVREGVHLDPAAPVQLYNLKNDPQETTNVAARYPGVVDRMIRFMRREHSPSPVPEWNFNFTTASSRAEPSLVAQERKSGLKPRSGLLGALANTYSPHSILWPQ